MSLVGGSSVTSDRWGEIRATIDDPAAITLEQVETLPNGEPNIVRCPDSDKAAEMVALIERLRGEQNSIGGVAEIVATSVPAGIGEPVFDKLKADLGKALFSLPAVLGVEYGNRLWMRDASWNRQQRSLLFRAG